MKPVLLSFNSYTITTLGVFLVLSFLLALLVIWRIIRGLEIDKEKTIDLFLLTSMVSLLGARAYFVFSNSSLSENPLNFFLVNKYPGFSFWGGFILGFIFLNLVSKKLKINFWQAADLAIIALFLGISITSLGCLFNSCQYGIVSNLPIAVSQTGLVGKRFPLQIIESLLFFLGFLVLWSSIKRFHFSGSIALTGLFMLGGFKFFLEFFRGDNLKVGNFLSSGHIWSTFFIFLAAINYYKLTRKSFKEDVLNFLKIFYIPTKRRLAVSRLAKSWYNLKIDLKISLNKFFKNLIKVLNIKSNPTKF